MFVHDIKQSVWRLTYGDGMGWHAFALRGVNITFTFLDEEELKTLKNQMK